MPCRLVICAVACSALLAGCALFPAREPEAPPATLPSWMGRVVMVDEEHGFALVDTGAPVLLPVGAKLLSFSEGRRTAVLQVTAENRPPYLALEILEGQPRVEDEVALDESRAEPGS